ncbi:ABC transporter substrate-binding protein [Acidovorax cavernicola]|uniref:ABC transporter substrate-binding protein n=1 Tax=Acidovorax cavernicola TaxID=1675792 RepID=A0A9X8CZT7_9BURK|nr:ABC transporter substrate-binding protein [Acidovorax cavernicola]RIX73646.1 ABC transporter substrate-binding protein [Acidovorax cavernicola]
MPPLHCRFAFLLLGLGLSIQAAAQVPLQPGAAPIRIGVIGPFTGPSADFGVPMLNGVKMATDEINAVGGYLGRSLELVIKDDQANPEIGRSHSQALANEKVVATIGFCNTGVAMNSLSVFNDAKLPLIVPCATGSPLTSTYPPATSYVFRTSPKDGIQAPFVVDDLLARGWKRIAVLHDATGYGEAGLKDVEKALAARNLKPVYVGRFQLGVKDLTKELSEAKAAGADVIFSYTVGPENAVIARSRQALGWKVPQVGPWTLSFPSFIDGARDAAEGTLVAQSFIAEPSNERRSSFLSNYTRKFNAKRIPVPMAAAQAYDATYLLAHAMFNVPNGKLEGPAIKTALEQPKRPYYGVVTTYDKSFSDKDKDAISSNMLVMGVVRNGQITFAYPEDAKRNLFVQRKQ